MTHPTIFDNPLPTTELAVHAFERELGSQLPDSYRAFLLGYNGGYPQPNAFPIADFYADTHGILDWFFGLNTQDMNDLRYNRRVFADRIPPEYLPIARDPGGNLLCLLLTGPNYAQIFYWDHETEALEGPPTTDNLFFVAATFQDLLTSLAELDET